MTPENPTTRAAKRYTQAVYLTLLASVITAYLSRTWLQHGLTAPARIMVAVLPAVPMLFCYLSAFRFMRETDELQARGIVDSTAVAGAITVTAAVIYSFLENAGFTRLSAEWTWGIFGVSWSICAAIFLWKYRHA